LLFPLKYQVYELDIVVSYNRHVSVYN
jgi:hypothetical protein